jgi:long-chain acyl-CoA synthetase
MDTIGSMFLDNAKRYADRICMKAYIDRQWKSFSWKQVEENVRHFAYGLLSLGLEPGDKVALMSENRPEWAWTDLAVLCLGGAIVTIYPSNTAPQAQYIIQNSEAKYVALSQSTHLEKIRQVRGELKNLQQVILFDPPESGEKDYLTFTEVVEMGRQKPKVEEFEKRVAALKPDDLLTLIYTSGTTGNPKGVMLTHDNLMSNIKDVLSKVELTSTDMALSFLPLSHSLERMAGYYTLLSAGIPFAYARSIETLGQDMMEIKPTVMICVPRIFEKIYAALMKKIQEESVIKRTLFERAVDIGKKVSKLKQAKKPVPLLLDLQYKLFSFLVFSKISERVGGRIRFLVSGGAPLAKELAEFFHAAGLLVLEGYGLTESSPVITVNTPENYRFGSVGRAIPSVKVKIAPDGEILASGPNIMKGYYKNPEATAEALEKGWLHTGDVGFLDDDGFLYITDRKKDIIVTAGGKNIAPQNIENLLKMQNVIEQSCVIGDQKRYLVALIVPSRDFLKEEFKKEGLTFSDSDPLSQSEKAKAYVQKAIDVVNAGLARYETIKRFAILDETFTVENGTLTPTLKVKRKAVMKKYETLIDSLYEGDRVTDI